MLSNFKARVRRWAELTHSDLCNLLKWSPCPIETDNPHALVCSASKDGHPIGYMLSEPVFLIHSYALAPRTSPDDLQSTGDVIDQALALEAQRAGVGRMLIVVPDDAPRELGEKVLRVLERDFAPIAAIQGADCPEPSPNAYVN